MCQQTQGANYLQLSEMISALANWKQHLYFSTIQKRLVIHIPLNRYKNTIICKQDGARKCKIGEPPLNCISERGGNLKWSCSADVHMGGQAYVAAKQRKWYTRISS